MARVRQVLPDVALEPVVTKGSNNGEIWLNVGGGGLSGIELSTLIESRVKDRLTRLSGVAQVVIVGESRYSIRLWIDTQRLAGPD